jgi:ribosomal subunit interface protein
MQIFVTGKNIDIGEAFRTYINEHITNAIKKHFVQAFDAHVTLSQIAHLSHVDITVHAGRGVILKGSAEHTDHHAAFDAALHKVEKRLTRYKERIKDHHNRQESWDEESAQQYVLSGEYRNLEGTLDEKNLQPTIIAEMSAEIPTLTVSDAVMRMDLADLPVLMFRNQAHGGFNIVYLRADGHIGWLDPEGNKNVKKIA